MAEIACGAEGEGLAHPGELHAPPLVTAAQARDRLGRVASLGQALGDFA